MIKNVKKKLPTLTENFMINKVNEFEQSVINKDEHIDSYELIRMMAEFFILKMSEEIYAIDLLIKTHTNDKEFKFIPKRIKSKLPIYTIGFIKN